MEKPNLSNLPGTRDEDDLDSNDITKKEFDSRVKALIKKHLNDKPVNPKSDKLAQGTIDALNKLFLGCELYLNYPRRIPCLFPYHNLSL